MYLSLVQLFGVGGGNINIMTQMLGLSGLSFIPAHINVSSLNITSIGVSGLSTSGFSFPTSWKDRQNKYYKVAHNTVGNNVDKGHQSSKLLKNVTHQNNLDWTTFMMQPAKKFPKPSRYNCLTGIDGAVEWRIKWRSEIILKHTT